MRLLPLKLIQSKVQHARVPPPSPPVPYLTCPRCAAIVYSAARWSSVDYCPGCGTELRDHDRLLKKAAALKQALSDARHGRQSSGGSEPRHR
jgi:Zn-finger nucleic acid-binding protein